MYVQVFNSKEEASKAAFDLFKETIENNPQATFGLATGSTPEPLYQLLRESDLDFSQATALNLDEYYGLSADHPQSYAYFMKEQLFDHKPFKETFIPQGDQANVEEETARYDQVLAEHPIDLQILGVGNNAHIGFNEPGSSFDATTRCVDLTDTTIQANKRFFDSAEDVPTKAYSMGIKSIMDAKKIILLAFGENKAQAVKDMIEGPVTTDVPASILQEHPQVAVFLDKEAASLLNN
ncbi:glucosamine-6-phosphate deaminase [Ignavigranum ruoffiae]|uniref:glucosamine-6-phosphate deaminase n=1 Tax=Ignavigranum ruoffiae TaxID=89093 RepID=UPI0020670F63|nr:glucosamine-6-phosphate deaminase [Ignavigranum ruoffiae]UPQ86080.1 glucosamine-6-phosphate deaminase [Ignavigranum ruoffiae]